MAAVTQRATFNSTSNTTSYTSGSFTPGNGELLVCGVSNTGSIAATPTLTDSLGGTWTQVANGQWSSAANEISIFVRDALIGTGTSMTVTFDCSADASTGVIIQVVGVSGMTRAGASAALQTATNNNGASTTPVTTFGAAAQTGNPTLVFFSNKANPAGVTIPSGWTQQDSTAIASSPTTGGVVVSRDSGFTGTAITWGSTSSTVWGAAAVELDASSPSLTPGTGAITLAGFAPVLNAKITPGAGAITLAGFSPSLVNVVQITTGVGAIQIQGFAPTLQSVTQVTPPAGAITVAGIAPRLNAILTPPVGAITAAGFAPSLRAILTPPVGTLQVAGLAPSLKAILTPPVGAVSVQGFPPTLLTVQQLVPGVGALQVQGYEPTLVVVAAARRRGRGNIKFVVDPEEAEIGGVESGEPLRPAPAARPLPDAPAAPAPRAARAELPQLPRVKIVGLEEDDDEEALLFILAHLL